MKKFNSLFSILLLSIISINASNNNLNSKTSFESISLPPIPAAPQTIPSAPHNLKNFTLRKRLNSNYYHKNAPSAFSTIAPNEKQHLNTPRFPDDSDEETTLKTYTKAFNLHLITSKNNQQFDTSNSYEESRPEETSIED
jgi:hypothetical protein